MNAIQTGMAPAAIFFCRFTLAYAGIWLYTLAFRKERRIWNGWKNAGGYVKIFM